MKKLYKVIRNYKYSAILELCWAEDKAEVYKILSWEEKDKPPLEIEEITKMEGCFLSVSIKPNAL